MLWRRLYIKAVMLCVCGTILHAQSDEESYPVNAATLFGIGGYNLMDTYLTPSSRIPYKGWGIRVLDERMKITRLADHRISRQQIVNVDVSSTGNEAGTTRALNGFVDYTLGYHYRFEPLPDLKVLTGASLHAMLGFIYYTRSSNNPASAKADLDLNVSAMALYNLRFRNYPLTFRYQFEIPFAGILFSPHAGQSYYEIFSRGNRSGVVPFTSIHNKQAMKNYLTVDFPIGKFTFRAGYLNSLYYLNVNGIRSHILSNSFVIGFVKEFVIFGGKHDRKIRHKSAYY